MKGACREIEEKGAKDKMNILSSSILAADFAELGEGVRETDRAGAQYIHVDVMDGQFVPTISFGMPVIRGIRKVTDKVFDVHLMIDEPERYLEDFAKAGADIITVHLETLKYPEQVIAKIRALNCKVGLAINPETSVHAVEPYLHLVDMVLIMTVRPGFGGQKYLDYCTEKINRVYNMIKRKNLRTDIEVDGGINRDNIGMVLDAGANVIVMGSSIFNGNIAQNTEYFVKLMQEKDSRN